MTTCENESGFTLIEVIVVLAVLGVLLGTAMPLASAVIEGDRRQEVRGELAAIGVALDTYYFEHASFPASLTANDFLGVHLQAGVGGTSTTDPFAAGAGYRYTVNNATNVATVYSLGENGVDDGAGAEEYLVNVDAASPGWRRTWMRLHLAVEVLANHVEAGGSVSGSWPSVRAAIGLGATYDFDGWGTTLQWTDTSFTLSSAGPDRTFGTADDITL